MAGNANNARIYGSDLDALYLAPYGTPLPSAGAAGLTEAPNGAFEEVGWLHSDGVSEELSGTKERIRAHQGNAVIRTRISEPGTEYTFHALEDKAQTQSLRYDEKSVATASGVRTTSRGPGQKVSVRTALIDFFDADDMSLKFRLGIPRFEIVADGARTYGGSDISGFPFRGEQIGNALTWSNSPLPKTVWVETITGTGTAGTYTLLINGMATAPIAYNAVAATIQAAVNAMSGVTGVTATVTGTGPWTLTFTSSVVLAVNSAVTGAVVSVA